MSEVLLTCPCVEERFLLCAELPAVWDGANRLTVPCRRWHLRERPLESVTSLIPWAGCRP
jgi:hypothetical protein